MSIGKILVGIGLALVVAGLVVWAMERAGLPGPGRLPGDIVVRRGNFSFYFPLATSLILSLVVTLLLRFFWRGQ